MMKIIRLFLTVILLSFSISTFSQYFNEGAFKIARIIKLIDTYYVDSVNQDELIEKAVREILKQLDPHSTYLTRDEVKEMNESLQGNFEGIGIQFNVFNDTILVISPISGGPSEKVGILAGDRIVTIEGENVAGTGITTKGVRDRLLGKKGTKVTVSIKRKNFEELIDFEITRDKIPIFSLDAAYMVFDNVGYIKLNRFSLTMIDEFKNALTKLKKENIKHLIVDLQDNVGGYLQVAVELADIFLKNKKLIVYTKGIKNPVKEYLATEKGDFEDGRIIVLINEGSASASEIFAGAIQDWDRGIVIGRRSFGKGLVQNPLMLTDGSMLRLTVARYYTPTGRLIQKPYDKDKLVDYEMDLVHRYENGEFSNADSIHFSDSLKFFTLKNKRIVYGGGGIMPDIFIPIDTTYYSDYYRDLRRKGIISRFVLSYIDKNRDKILKKYDTFEEFNNEFKLSDKIFEDLLKLATKEGLERNEKEIQKSQIMIKLQIKALIARDIWDTSQFFEVFNILTPSFNKAIEVFKNWEKYSSTILKE